MMRALVGAPRRPAAARHGREHLADHHLDLHLRAGALQRACRRLARRRGDARFGALSLRLHRALRAAHERERRDRRGGGGGRRSRHVRGGRRARRRRLVDAPDAAPRRPRSSRACRSSSGPTIPRACRSSSSPSRSPTARRATWCSRRSTLDRWRGEYPQAIAALGGEIVGNAADGMGLSLLVARPGGLPEGAARPRLAAGGRGRRAQPGDRRARRALRRFEVAPAPGLSE